jgi:hypothetical protein
MATAQLAVDRRTVPAQAGRHLSHAQPSLLHPEQGPPFVKREVLKAAAGHGCLLMPTYLLTLLFG